MGNPVTVSVIMPTYNVEMYVGEAIRSVLDQTFTDFELLIRDDGSMDGTLGMVESFDDSRIVLLPQRDHVGAAQARNDAIALARGNYIAFHDADDISESERLKKQTEFLNARPGNILVSSFAIVVDQHNVPSGVTETVTADADIRETGFNRTCPIVHAAMMVRSDVLRKVGGYDSRFSAAHDYDLILRLLECGRADVLPESLYRVRFHSRSITAVNFLRQRAYADLARERSRIRRNGRDPDAGDAGARCAEAFRKIDAKEFGKDFLGQAWRERARWMIVHGMRGGALRCALRAFCAQGWNRDNLWMLRQALKALVFGCGAKL